MLPSKKYLLNRGYKQAERSNTKMAVALRSSSILEPRDQKKIPVVTTVVSEKDLKRDESEKRVRLLNLSPRILSVACNFLLVFKESTQFLSLIPNMESETFVRHRSVPMGKNFSPICTAAVLAVERWGRSM